MGKRRLRSTETFKVTTFEFEGPVDLPAYQESDAEKAARLGDIVQFERRVYQDGSVRYCVPGLEPDSAVTLERDGLIKQYDQGGRIIAEVYEPHNQRVLAWQIGLNGYCASLGAAPMFPEVPVVLIEAPTDTVQ
jgi:hypothetical protein